MVEHVGGPGVFFVLGIVLQVAVAAGLVLGLPPGRLAASRPLGAGVRAAWLHSPVGPEDAEGAAIGLRTMKFGGSSVADAEKIKNVAAAHRRGARGRRRRRGRGVRAGQDHRRPGGPGARDLRPPRPARDGHAAVHRRAHLVRADGDGPARPGPRRQLVHGLAGRHRHRRLPHQGQDRRDPRRPAARGPGRRATSCWSPASRACPTRPQRHHARPRRLRHHRRRPGRRARAPTSARSTPTSPACSPPTRAWSPAPASCRLVSHEEMLEMAASGLARCSRCGRWSSPAATTCPLHVRSSFLPEEGTWITKETPDMEKAIVSGVAHRSDEAKVTVSGVREPPRRGRAHLHRPGRRRTSTSTRSSRTWAPIGAAPTSRSPCRSTSCATALEALEGAARTSWATASVTSDDQIGKVTLVGAGMKSEPGVAAKMFRVARRARGSTSR